jgi:hypothetical protein
MNEKDFRRNEYRARRDEILFAAAMFIFSIVFALLTGGRH